MWRPTTVPDRDCVTVGVLHIPQISNGGASPSDGLMSYPEHSLQGCFTPLQWSCRYILQLQPTGHHSWRDQGFHAFPKSHSPKVNVIGQLELELADYDVIVQHVSQYAMVIPSFDLWYLQD